MQENIFKNDKELMTIIASGLRHLAENGAADQWDQRAVELGALTLEDRLQTLQTQPEHFNNHAKEIGLGLASWQSRSEEPKRLKCAIAYESQVLQLLSPLSCGAIWHGTCTKDAGEGLTWTCSHFRLGDFELTEGPLHEGNVPQTEITVCGRETKTVIGTIASVAAQIISMSPLVALGP